MAQEDDKLAFLKGLLLGGAVGAVLALLFAPKSGKELREDIARKATGLKEEAERRFEEVKTKTAELVEQGKEVVERERGRVKRAVEAGVEAVKGEQETGGRA